MSILIDSQGRQYQLDAKLAEGGEGIIYPVKSHVDLVAKIYKDGHRTSERETKLLAMVASPPQDDLKVKFKHPSISWPVAVVKDARSRSFQGFLMPRVNAAVPLINAYNPHAADFIAFNWKLLHLVAKNLCIAIYALHVKGYVMGDVNERNILVAKNGLITLVDTDSFQVRHGNQTFRCTVGVPEYTPAELHGKHFDKIDREPHHDSFGLAILIFRLLMRGHHPFNGAYKDLSMSIGKVDEYCIRSGIFPWIDNPHFFKPPSAYALSVLHPELQKLFVRTFINGHADPTIRPGPKRWLQALDMAQNELVQCKVTKAHWHWQGNTCQDCAAISKTRPLPRPTSSSRPTPSSSSIPPSRPTPPSRPIPSSRTTPATNPSSTTSSSSPPPIPPLLNQVVGFGVMLGLGLALYEVILLVNSVLAYFAPTQQSTPISSLEIVKNVSPTVPSQLDTLLEYAKRALVNGDRITAEPWLNQAAAIDPQAVTKFRQAQVARYVKIARTNNDPEYKEAALALAAEWNIVAEAKTADNLPVISMAPAHSRYHVYQNGTVTDTKTGWMWKRCSEGQHLIDNTCMGDTIAISWDQAMPHKIQRRWETFAGYADWRVPTAKELYTLVYCSTGEFKQFGTPHCNTKSNHPTIDSIVFPDTPRTWFWSASPDVSHTDVAWGVNFDNGYTSIDFINKSHPVRLIRAP